MRSEEGVLGTELLRTLDCIRESNSMVNCDTVL